MTLAPFRYICDLTYDFPDIGTWPWMTAFLVGPSTLLTAGHLVDSIPNFNRDLSFDHRRLTVFPGRRHAYKPFGGVRVKSYKRPKNYAPCASTDFMLLFLEKPLGREVGYWSFGYQRRGFDPVGTSTFAGGGLPLRPGVLKVNVCGYPDDKPPGRGCRRSVGRLCDPTFPDDAGRTKECGSYQYSAFNRTVALTDSNRIMTYLNDTCSGQSGSPVWVRRHSSKGGRVLLGVHICRVGSTANKCVFMHSGLRSFLRSNVR